MIHQVIQVLRSMLELIFWIYCSYMTFLYFPTYSTHFFYEQSILTLAPEIVSVFLKNRHKKLFSSCLVDGPLTSIV